MSSSGHQVFDTPEYEAANAEHDFDGMFEKLQVYFDFVEQAEGEVVARAGQPLSEMDIVTHGRMAKGRADRFLELVAVYVDDGKQANAVGLQDVVTLVGLTASAYRRYYNEYRDKHGGEEGARVRVEGVREAPHIARLFAPHSVEQGQGS